jgi:chemotaxis response regulator CheB
LRRGRRLADDRSAPIDPEWPLHRTRILLVALPALFRDILGRLVSGEADLELVGSLDRSDALVAEVDRTGADVVVLGVANGRLPTVCDQLLYTHCRSRVIAVEGDATSGFLYQLLPQKLPLGELDELGPRRLIDAMRAPAGAGALEC